MIGYYQVTIKFRNKVIVNFQKNDIEKAPSGFFLLGVRLCNFFNKKSKEPLS